MKDRGTLNTQEALVEAYLTANEPQTLVSKLSCSTKILDSEYKPACLDEVINMRDNLSQQEQQQLLHILQKYDHLFDGTLGKFNMDPVSLPLTDKETKPVRARSYTVPSSAEQQLHTAYGNCKISGHWSPRQRLHFWMGIPNICNCQEEWNYKSCFWLEKGYLNSLLKHHPFPIPKFGDMIQSMESFTFATALDLCMGYYHIKLDSDSQKLCIIVFPWGKYKYKHLPMGIKIATFPDVFQIVVSKLTQDMEYVKTYLDDLLILSNNYFKRLPT
jgi:hypothetical protein